MEPELEPKTDREMAEDMLNIFVRQVKSLADGVEEEFGDDIDGLEDDPYYEDLYLIWDTITNNETAKTRVIRVMTRGGILKNLINDSLVELRTTQTIPEELISTISQEIVRVINLPQGGRKNKNTKRRKNKHKNKTKSRKSRKNRIYKKHRTYIK